MKASTTRPRTLRAFLAALATTLIGTLVPLDAPGQATAATQVTGSFAFSDDYGDSVQGTFRCTGVPTCAGQYSMTYRDVDCSNSLTETDDLAITGLNLERTGALSGSLTLTLAEWSITFNPDRTCAYHAGQRLTQTIPWTGNYNATTGTGVMNVIVGSDAQGRPVTAPFTFKADVAPPAPVFPLTVQSHINAVTANAIATLQYRPQDVGTTGRVYVFAVAPAAQVKAGDAGKAMMVGNAWAAGKTDPPVTCLLAQLNAAGQLQAATPEQLQAALSGTLSSAGATLPILNNASTPAVAGSTFYVGYGADSSGMLANGLFRSAITVPGTGVCPMVSSQTALWWNPAESGWGLNLNHQGNTLFGTLFTYDAARAPLWLVMSKGEMQADGVTFAGDLYRTRGPAFNAQPFTPIGAGDITKVGTMAVSFQDVNSGTLRYSVNGTEVAKAIQREVFGTRAAACFPTTASRAATSNYQDLWWNPAESGWGLNLTHQGDTLFATLFTYDATGKGLWLVMSSGARQADGSYGGALYQTSGPVFNASPFGGVAADTVGAMSLRFSDGNNGTLGYTYRGAPVTKAITREVFASPLPLCY